MAIALAVLIVLFLAYANGANDNFKGVATLYGSGTATYRSALIWGTIATALGSLTAVVLAPALLAAFSGKGVVPDTVVAMKSFSLSIVLAAAITVMLASKMGFPISTTHALTGALVGAGLLTNPNGVNFAKLGSAFFAPLLVSPLMALLLAGILYPMLRFFQDRAGVGKESCVCIGTSAAALAPAGFGGEAIAMFSTQMPILSVGTQASCAVQLDEGFVGASASTLLARCHYFSAGIVCFARALNDTPKIAAILLAGALISPTVAIAGVALFMCIGGALNSQKIAETMAHKVTPMSPGQGFTANLVTGVLVIFASKLGFPVSTTHVSCGSLFGIGVATGQARWRTIFQILIAWVTTLPVAGILGAGIFLVLKDFVG